MTVEIGELCVLERWLNSGVPILSRKLKSVQIPRAAAPSGFASQLR